jgi:hypothetical protein
MSLIVLRDSGPLGLATRRPGRGDADECRARIAELVASGVLVLIPDIIDYEIRRELLRLGHHGVSGLARLDQLRGWLKVRTISSESLRRAAEFWALVRASGLSTAPDPALDVDAILAGMAATEGGLTDTVIVATDNARHLRRFPGVDARELLSIQAILSS